MSVCLDEQGLVDGLQSLTETELLHQDWLTNRAYGDEQYSHSSNAHSLHHSAGLHIRTTCSINSPACCFGHRDWLLYQAYVIHTHVGHNGILKDGSERDAGILHGNQTGMIKITVGADHHLTRTATFTTTAMGIRSCVDSTLCIHGLCRIPSMEHWHELIRCEKGPISQGRFELGCFRSINNHSHPPRKAQHFIPSNSLST